MPLLLNEHLPLYKKEYNGTITYYINYVLGMILHWRFKCAGVMLSSLHGLLILVDGQRAQQPSSFPPNLPLPVLYCGGVIEYTCMQPNLNSINLIHLWNHNLINFCTIDWFNKLLLFPPKQVWLWIKKFCFKSQWQCTQWPAYQSSNFVYLSESGL